MVLGRVEVEDIFENYSKIVRTLALGNVERISEVDL
jgi:hypothetical protein